MPKDGPSDFEWRRRLFDYAVGKLRFGRGEGPRKLCVKKAKEAIDSCPANIETDMFGRMTKCCCKYHHVCCD